MMKIEIASACLLALISFVAAGWVIYRDFSGSWTFSDKQCVIGSVALSFVGVCFIILAIIRFFLKDQKEMDD